MTVKNFWLILLKILGVWLVMEGVMLVPSLFSSLFLVSYSYFETSPTLAISLFIAAILFYAIILYLFVFNTSWIINKLDLEKGFENENLTVNISQVSVLRISTIIIGGITFIENLPFLVKSTYSYLQSSTNPTIAEPTAEEIFYNLALLFLGYLLMVYNQKVVNLVTKFSKDEKEE